MSARAVNLTGSGVLAVGGVVVVAVLVGGLAYWLYRNRDKFNPASSNNLANKGASSVVRAITGGAASGGEDTVGGVFARIREKLSGDDAKIEAMKQGTVSQDKVKPTLPPNSIDDELRAGMPVGSTDSEGRILGIGGL